MVFCACRLTYTFMGKWVDKNTASDTKPLLNEYLGLTFLTCIAPCLGLFFSILPVSLISLSGYESLTMFVLCEPTCHWPSKRDAAVLDGAWKWQTGKEGCILSFISFLAVFSFSFALCRHNYSKPFSFLCCVKIYLLTST